MNSETYREIESARKSVRWGALEMAALVLLLVGAVAFFHGIYSGSAERAWNAYLINFVYWTGLASGTLLLSPILVITNGAWGRPVKRLAESAALFLPVSFVMLWPLFIAREKVFWWVLDPEPQKAFWLNTQFFFAREGISIFVLAAVAVSLVYHSVKSDMEYLSGNDRNLSSRSNAQLKLSTAYVILYAFILTVIAIDFMMSLNRQWYSTLFGAYYFAVSFYGGLAALILISAFAVMNMGLSDLIGKKQFHDLGKLLFAFCVVSGDFFYVQFLVIWYGNKPEETRYVLARIKEDPWSALAWAVLFIVFVVPFVILLLRKIKMKPFLMTLVSLWILFGIWLEKFLLVAPSLLKTKVLPLGILELLITLGWLGLFSFCILWFLSRYPAVALSDPLLGKAIEPKEEAAQTI